MIKNWWVWERLAKPEAKLARYLLGLGTLGLIFLLLGGLFAPQPQRGNSAKEGQESGQAPLAQPAEQAEPTLLAQRLAIALSRIEGAGEVYVEVTLADSGRVEYARDRTSTLKETEETDQAGGKRLIREETQEDKHLLLGEGGRRGEPVVVVKHTPEIKGVLVVASGARNPKVKAALFEAVKTFLALPAHKVVVLAGRG